MGVFQELSSFADPSGAWFHDIWSHQALGPTPGCACSVWRVLLGDANGMARTENHHLYSRFIDSQRRSKSLPCLFHSNVPVLQACAPGFWVCNSVYISKLCLPRRQPTQWGLKWAAGISPGSWKDWGGRSREIWVKVQHGPTKNTAVQNGGFFHP